VLAETLCISQSNATSLLQSISIAKRIQQAPSAEIAAAAAAYAREMAFNNWVDFDDLIGLPVQALLHNPNLAGQLRTLWRAVSVDEFQDVDEQQYRLLKVLAPENADLCVIGDPDQAIYGFRGADATCFQRFTRDYPAAKIVRLSRNYRSSGTIVTASAQVIANSRSTAVAKIVRGMHERIAIYTAPTERAEAEHVVQSIERLIGGHSFFSIDSGRAAGGSNTNLSFADFAVLYRTGAQADAVCEAFIRSGIPFKKHAHALMASDPSVRTLLQELENESEARPLVEQLHAAAERLKARDGADQTAIVMAWQRLMALTETSGQDRARLVDAVAVANDEDFFDPRADRVSLLTMHAAKGLEFRVVFIVGLEDGLLPLTYGERDEAALAEERRLFYVGMTRAKDQLILSRAMQRHWRGGLRNLPASPFLADIESELLKHQQAKPLRRKPEDRQLKLF
jgi:DNA helicase II / ATP-dependent DNA helicase PcrA